MSKEQKVIELLAMELAQLKIDCAFLRAENIELEETLEKKQKTEK